MKIVLSSLNFAPELTGIGKYSGEMAEALVSRGHEVVVVCAHPYYPHWQRAAGYPALGWRIERPRPGLTVVRCPLYVPGRPSGLRRLLHLASFAAAALPVMLALSLWRPALVFAVVPALFTAPAALLCARLAGARAWLHVQDFELDAAFELGMLRGTWLRRVVGAVERRVLRGFDHVSTISRRMLRQLASKGVPLDQGRLLPNWVNLTAVRPLPRAGGLRASLGIGEDQVVCLFSGTMNRKQGLPVLLQAMDLLQRRDVVLVLCGSGEVRGVLQAAAAGRTDVRLLELQPAERLNELLNMADIHLLPQLAGAADLVMPSKLSGMLASGRPVIAAAMPGTEIARAVEGRGLRVAPGDAGGFARAIASLADDPAQRAQLGLAARAYAEQALGLDGLLARLEQALVEHRPVAEPAAQPRG